MKDDGQQAKSEKMWFCVKERTLAEGLLNASNEWSLRTRDNESHTVLYRKLDELGEILAGNVDIFHLCKSMSSTAIACSI